MSSDIQEQRTSPAPTLRSRSERQELTVALLLGAVGAGLVFLATRQGWAVVRTIVPKPLPVSRVTVTGAALVPYADALVIAGLATLAAILASRRLLRRAFGVLLAVIGAGLAASAFALSAATAVSAASASVSPETAAAGSVTDGSGTATTTAPDVAGTQTHVLFSATGWQVLVVAGALAIIAAGIVVAVRANRMAVMSSRYDSPTAPGRRARRDAARATAGTPADSASVWEALSRGDDPTSAIPPSGP